MLIAKLLSGILVLAWLVIRPPFQFLSAVVAWVIRMFRGRPAFARSAVLPPRHPRSADLACHGSQTALHAVLVAGDPSRVRVVNADFEALCVGFGELERAGRRVREIHASMSTMRQFRNLNMDNMDIMDMSGVSAYDRPVACEGSIMIFGASLLHSAGVPQGKMMLVGD